MYNFNSSIKVMYLFNFDFFSQLNKWRLYDKTLDLEGMIKILEPPLSLERHQYDSIHS